MFMAQDFSRFAKMLDEEEARLITELETVGRRNPRNTDDWEGTPGDIETDNADPNERADKIEEFVERSAVAVALEKELNLVQKAKQKIKNGAYGVCEVGGEPIEEDRLSANPSAATCKKHMNG